MLGESAPERRRKMKKTRWSIIDLAMMGLLIALTIVASRYLSFNPTPWMRFTFSYSFIMLAGIWLGPITGGIVGGVADLLGCVLSGQTPLLLFTVSPVVVGVLCGFLAPVFKKYKNPFVYAGLVTVVTLITTVLIGSFALSFLYHMPFWVTAGERAVQAIVSIILNTIVVFALYTSPVTSMLNAQRERFRVF